MKTLASFSYITMLGPGSDPQAQHPCCLPSMQLTSKFTSEKSNSSYKIAQVQSHFVSPNFHIWFGIHSGSLGLERSFVEAQSLCALNTL